MAVNAIAHLAARSQSTSMALAPTPFPSPVVFVVDNPSKGAPLRNIGNTGGPAQLSELDAMMDKLNIDQDGWFVRANACSRATCEGTSGVFICNDSADAEIDTKLITKQVSSIQGSCANGDQLQGQQFIEGGYNVIVSKANCDLVPRLGPDQQHYGEIYNDTPPEEARDLEPDQQSATKAKAIRAANPVAAPAPQGSSNPYSSLNPDGPPLCNIGNTAGPADSSSVDNLLADLNSAPYGEWIVFEHDCTRMGCWDGSGIFLCNDSDEVLAANSGAVASQAAAVKYSCTDGSKVHGQQFVEGGKLNIVVAAANCAVSYTNGPDQQALRRRSKATRTSDKVVARVAQNSVEPSTTAKTITSTTPQGCPLCNIGNTAGPAHTGTELDELRAFLQQYINVNEYVRPHGCVRPTCVTGSAVFLCNDSDEGYNVAKQVVIDQMNVIVGACTNGGDVQGQQFIEGRKLNVVLSASDCRADGHTGPDPQT